MEQTQQTQQTQQIAPALTLKKDECPTEGAIEELKMKLSLRARSNKMHIDQAALTKKRQQGKIFKLQNENRNYLLDIAEINKITLRKSKPGWKSERSGVNEEVISKAEDLNSLLHERHGKRQYLRKLKAELDAMKSIKEANYDEDEETLRSLENNVDKAHTKKFAVDAIGSIYNKMYDNLKKESLTYTAIIQDLEMALEQQKKEIIEMDKIRLEAIALRDKNQIIFSGVETSLESNKCRRDAERMAKTRQVEKQKVQVAEAERMAVKTIVHDSHLIKHEEDASLKRQSYTTRFYKIEEYDKQFKCLKLAVKATNWEDLIQAMVEQEVTTIHLQQQCIDQHAELQKFKNELMKLKDNLDSLKYDETQNSQKNESRIAQKNRTMRRKEERMRDLLPELRRAAHLSACIKSGVDSIYFKLGGTRRFESHDYLEEEPEQLTERDTEAQLLIIETAVEMLKDRVSRFDEAGVTEEAIDKMNKAKWYQVELDKSLGEDYVRVNLTEFDTTDDFEYDLLEDNEEALTREEIKAMAQRIIDSKNRRLPKKRKSKQKFAKTMM